MILYVNGDSHTAAAEAVNPCAFAEDDAQYRHLGREPHPDNFAVSWPVQLAQQIPATLCCHAESASSNYRIMRTTRDWIMSQPVERRQDTVAIIQWSTWERQEWLIDGRYYQVTASGTDDVPPEHHQRYKEFISRLDWTKIRHQAHEQIWLFHEWLNQRQVRHVFFNGNSEFSQIGWDHRRDWGTSYIAPYNREDTYDAWLRRQGQVPVHPKSWHFGAKAHCIWAKFMLEYCIDNKIWI